MTNKASAFLRLEVQKGTKSFSVQRGTVCNIQDVRDLGSSVLLFLLMLYKSVFPCTRHCESGEPK